MTRSADQANITVRQRATVVCAVFLLACGAFCQVSQQLDLRGGAVWGKATLQDEERTGIELLGTGYLSGDYPIGSWFHFLVRDRFDGLSHRGPEAEEIDAITAASQLRPYAHRNVASSNDALLGVRLTPLGEAIISQRLVHLLDVRGLDENSPRNLPAYYEIDDPAGWGMVDIDRTARSLTKAKSYTRAFWEVPVGGFSASADLTAASQYAELRSWDYNAETDDYNVLAGMQANTDINLWTRIIAQYTAENGLGGGAEVFLKNNFSGRASYNIGRYSLFVRGTHAVPSTTNKLTWALAGKWYQSEAMAKKGYSDKLNGEAYVRDVWMFATGWYTKATATLRWGNYGMFKHRYELSLRRASRKESAAEGGYFANIGGLFPTQGPYLRCNLRLGQRIDLSADGKVVFEGPDMNAAKVTYLKWQIMPEVAFMATGWLDIYAGAEYTTYSDDIASGFPASTAIFLGVRSIIH